MTGEPTPIRDNGPYRDQRRRLRDGLRRDGFEV